MTAIAISAAARALARTSVRGVPQRAGRFQVQTRSYAGRVPRPQPQQQPRRRMFSSSAKVIVGVGVGVPLLLLTGMGAGAALVLHEVYSHSIYGRMDRAAKHAEKQRQYNELKSHLWKSLQKGNVKDVDQAVRKLGVGNPDVDYVYYASCAASSGNFEVLKYFIEERGVIATDLYRTEPYEPTSMWSDDLPIPGRSDSLISIATQAKVDVDAWWEIVEYLLAKGCSFMDVESYATPNEETWMTTKQKCVEQLTYYGQKEKLMMLIEKTGLEWLSPTMLRMCAEECKKRAEFNEKIAEDMGWRVEDIDSGWNIDGKEFAGLLTSWVDQIERKRDSASSESSRIV